MSSKKKLQKLENENSSGAVSGAVLPLLSLDASDEALMNALKKQNPGAKRLFYTRYADHVQRVLIRIIGIDDAIPELISETFLQAFSSVHSLRNGSSLKAWVSMIAVFTARGLIRKRKKRRLMRLFEPKKMQDVLTFETDTDAREALRVMYEILEEMPTDERVAFSLRFIEGMHLREVADVCGVSLATIKRRLSRAQQTFVPMAKEDPLLKKWIERGERWGDK
jgi:RNA polymerase sigma-70 factor, ECF subfamily